MINIPKNYKEGDILVVKNGRLEAVDPKSIFNVDNLLTEIKNELEVNNQLLRDAKINDKKLVDKLNEFEANGVKLNNLAKVVEKYIVGVVSK